MMILKMDKVRGNIVVTGNTSTSTAQIAVKTQTTNPKQLLYGPHQKQTQKNTEEGYE